MKVIIDIHNRTIPAEGEWIEECIDAVDDLLTKYGINASINVEPCASQSPMQAWLKDKQAEQLLRMTAK